MAGKAHFVSEKGTKNNESVEKELRKDFEETTKGSDANVREKMWGRGKTVKSKKKRRLTHKKPPGKKRRPQNLKGHIENGSEAFSRWRKKKPHFQGRKVPKG